MATFKMAEGEQREPVSPLDAPEMDFPPPSRGHIMEQWRPSIEAVVTDSSSIKKDKPAWAPPPLPPIPREKEPEAWRKRSLKRCSLASQLSNYSTTEFPSDFVNKHSRKASAVSSVKSYPSRNFSRPTRWKEERSQSTDLNWKMAIYNPQNWSQAKKWFHTLTAGGAGFTCTLTSSIVPPSLRAVDNRFGSSSMVLVLPLALFPAGLALGPLLNALLSELVGRKVVLIASMAAFALVTLGSAFIDSFWPFMACRIVAAVLASPALDATLSVLLDIWPARTRSTPLVAYSLLFFYGIALGPTIALYLLHFEGRSWMQYVILFAFAACIVPLVSMSETHRATLRRRTSSGSTFGRFTSAGFAGLGRPFYLLCRRPQVLLCTLLASCNFGTLYAAITIFPSLLAAAYETRAESRGLAFIGMIVGVTIGCILLIATKILLQYTSRSRLDRNSAPRLPKNRPSSNHIHMDSRTSTTPFRHTQSAMSDLGQSRTASRLSLPMLKLGAALQDSDKNMDVAVAMANYLNDLPSNKENAIEPERVLSVLEQSLAFDDLCLLLEGYDLVFDRGVLAVTLAETLPTSANDAEDLKMPKTTVSSRVSTPVTEDKMWPLPPDSPAVITQARASQVSRNQISNPPRKRSPILQHLFVTLLGCVLSTGGLFMFGWTIQLEQPWIVPVVAMGIVACGNTLVFVSTTEYLMGSFSARDGEHAVSACNTFRWIFAAAFSVVSVPLYNALRPEWATSVLGFINAGGVLLVLILFVLERLSKKNSTSSAA